MDTIRIRGARTHNLKNINLDIPRDQMIVITGLSGSGKSSLAFDTIYADGQRRYVESLSAYARQFLSMMEKPDVDHIEGLSPAISIEQKSTSHNPRSTVGTITEIYDYLRLLFARVGEPHCPQHRTLLAAQTISQMVDLILEQPEGSRLMLLAPVVQDRKGEHIQQIERIRAEGFVRARIDGKVVELDNIETLDLRRRHTIEVVVDRFRVRADIGLRLAESLETAVRLSDGLAIISSMGDAEADEIVFSTRFACPECGYSLSELEPRLFSFNNPAGACDRCDGLGVIQYFDADKIVLDRSLSLADGAIRGWDRRNAYYFQLIKSLSRHYRFAIDTPYADLDERVREVVLYGSGEEQIEFEYLHSKRGIVHRTHTFEGVIPNMQRRYLETESVMIREELNKYQSSQPCPSCAGQRLNEAARNVFINDINLPAISAMPVMQAQMFFKSLAIPGRRGEIATRIVKEVDDRLRFLVNVGLDYLTLDRSAETLSGGEAQRIRLASQIGAGLVGVMYVLDEPSIGLHQRDNKRLLATLQQLRDLGNTVIVVEHDEEAINSADHVIDMGPGAGVHGGKVVVQGYPEDIAQCPDSLTGAYLSGRKRIDLPPQRVMPDPERVVILSGATGNNLKSIQLELPLGLMTCVTGVSGSGKSTLVNDTLYRIAASELNYAGVKPAPYQSISGLEYIDKVVDMITSIGAPRVKQAPLIRLSPRSGNCAPQTEFQGTSQDLQVKR